MQKKHKIIIKDIRVNVSNVFFCWQVLQNTRKFLTFTKKEIKYYNEKIGGGVADKEDEEVFNKLLKNEKSGTIVILEQCVGIKNRNVNQFSGRMKTSLGRIYRKFMSKIEFYVNDMKVEEDDPLLLDDEGTEEYSETDYEVKWKDKNGNEKNQMYM